MGTNISMPVTATFSGTIIRGLSSDGQGGSQNMAQVATWDLRMEKGLKMSDEIRHRNEQEVEVENEGGTNLRQDSQTRLEGLTPVQQRNLQRLQSTTFSQAKVEFSRGIKSTSLFKRLHPELLDELFDIAIPVFVRRGELILEKGAVGQVMFVIIKGSVQAAKDVREARIARRQTLARKKSIIRKVQDLVNQGGDNDLDDLDEEAEEVIDENDLDFEETDSGEGLENQDSASKLNRAVTRVEGLQDTIANVEDKDIMGSSVFPEFLNSGSIRKKTLTKGHAIGSHCVLLNTPHSWTVTAKQDSLLLAVHRIQFQDASHRVSQRRRLKYSSEQRRSWLERFPFIGKMNKAKLQYMGDVMDQLRFGAGEVILAAGEELRGFYIVLSGTVTSKFENEELHWHTQGDNIGAGAFVAVGSDMDSSSSSVTKPVLGVEFVATSEEPVECLFLDFDHLVREKRMVLRDVQMGPNEKAIADEAFENLVRDALESNSLLGLLSTDEIRQIQESITVEKFMDGDQIIGEREDLGDGSVYLILHGAVRMRGMRLPPSGRESTRQRRTDVGRRTTARSSILALQRGFSQQNLSSEAIQEGMELAGSPDHAQAYEEVNHKPAFDENSVMLLESETFGEECLELQRSISSMECIAFGTVYCVKIPKKLLRRLEVLDKVRRVYFREGPGPPVERQRSIEMRRRAWHRMSTRDLADSFSMSDNFLLLPDFLEIEQNEDGAFTARRKSLVETITKENMKVVTKLHETRMTSVFLALHSKSGQLCVVKSTNIERANMAGMGRFVLTEQSILAQINHPFVVKLLSAWHESPSNFVALEPALGGSLERFFISLPDVVRGEFGNFNFETCRFVAACILLGLKHLYEHRIVHRDMKPANILIDHHGYPKLADFGMSKNLQHRTSRCHTFVGTPKYMAPELASLASGSSSGYGIGVDYWAFGVICYKMATGKDCFARESAVRVGADSMDKTLSAICVFGERHRDSDADHEDPFFERRNDEHLEAFNDSNLVNIQDSGDDWLLYANFVADLMHPESIFRLGSSHYGPRGAMNHPLFGEIQPCRKSVHHLEPMDWTRLLTKSVKPPLLPRKSDLIVDVKHLRKLHNQLRSELREAKKKEDEAGMMRTIPEDVEEEPAGKVETREESSRRPNLAKAREKMQNYSVMTLHSVSDELEEQAVEEKVEEEQKQVSIEAAVREKLEFDFQNLMTPTLDSKRQLRSQTMLMNRRKARILELKHRTHGGAAALTPHLLHTAALAEARHQSRASFNSNLDE